jgi:dGTPase
LHALAPRYVADLRLAGEPAIGFSARMAAADRAIKGFLSVRMYRHARIGRIMGEAEGVVCDLFTRYIATPADMPVDWAQNADVSDEPGRLRRVADFIAGMTDRYALIEHARLFAVTPELR